LLSKFYRNWSGLGLPKWKALQAAQREFIGSGVQTERCVKIEAFMPLRGLVWVGLLATSMSLAGLIESLGLGN